MSAVTLQQASWREASRRESHQVPAGILALAVHGAFFSLLYFGFAWQTQYEAAMSVELWESLPETVNAPLAEPRAEETVQPVQPEKIAEPDIAQPEPKVAQPEPEAAQPEPKIAQPEPDIALPAEKKTEVRRETKKPVKKEDAKLARKHAEQEAAEQNQARLAEQQAARERAEQAAAKGRVLNEYRTKIQNKITRNIVMPPGVPDDSLALFRVTLLPGGGVLSTEMKKSSGNAAYDNAVERAIYKSDPLPLPPDAALFNDFRVLRLEFQPRRTKE